MSGDSGASALLAGLEGEAARDYAAALSDFLQQHDEATLYRATLLSGSFVDSGLGPEDITALHAEAVERLLDRWETPDDARRLIGAAHRFLLEVMVQYGARYREYQETKVEERLAHEREKSTMLSSIAHEIGTPLTVAQGFVRRARRALARGDGAAGVEEALQEADAALERLSMLNQSLRHASREGEPPDLALEPQPLAPILEQITRWARVLADEKRLSFTWSLEAPNARLVCDREAVLTICSNLITNAVRYTPPEGQVELRAGVDGEWVWLEVRDTGIGMTEETQRQVFERFYRAPEAQRVSAKGLGLGLATVRSLVEALQGRLTFESAPGKGTTFRVLLPNADWDE